MGFTLVIFLLLATPIFAAEEPTVTLTLISPAGTITADPPSSDGRYRLGAVVRFTAQGYPGWSFMRWEGDASGTEQPIAMALHGNTTVRAVFGSPIHVEEPANGRIDTVPAIESGVVYRNYTDVRFTAAPNAGYHFESWSGALVGAAASAIYYHNRANASVAARFALLPAGKVTLTALADSGGTASVFDYRQNGGAKNYYDAHAIMGIVARPAPGRVFVGWSGDATGTENPLILRLDTSKTVRARFVIGASLTINATDGGSVLRDPPPESLPNGVYGAGLHVRLTAVPQDGFSFAGWTGPIASYEPTVALEVRGNHTVNARFAAAPWTPNAQEPVSAPTPNGGRAAIGLDGTSYFTIAENGTRLLRAVASDGSTRWQRAIEPGNLPAGVPAIQSDVVIGENVGYVVQGDGSLLAFHFDGSARWTLWTGDLLQTPSIGGDGELYTGSRVSAMFYAINANGFVRWATKPGLGPYSIAAVGADGAVYVADQQSLFALDSTGRKIREYRVGAALSSPIFHERQLAVSIPARTFFFNLASGAAFSTWPMRDADASGSAIATNPVARPPELEHRYFPGFGVFLIMRSAPGHRLRLYQTESLDDWTRQHDISTTGQAFTTLPPEGPRRFFRVSHE